MSRSDHALVAALSRSRDPLDPELVAAKQRLKSSTLMEAIRRRLADFPPLTAEQRFEIAALVLGGRDA